MKQWVFLSYDMSFQGSFAELYKWLDVHKAQECGDSFCRFVYDFKSIAEDVTSEEETMAMVREIRADLTKAVHFLSSERVYIVTGFFVKGKKQPAGIFLVGNRKQTNPWDGASGEAEFQQNIDE